MKQRTERGGERLQAGRRGGAKTGAGLEAERSTGAQVPGTEVWRETSSVDTGPCHVPETKDELKAAATVPGRDRVSATTLLTPEVWRRSEVNSAR